MESKLIIPDVFNEQCGTRAVLDLLADKWTVLVVAALAKGKLRYSDLRRILQGISHKMLTQTLRRLEGDGLLTRTVYPVVPPMVEYELTPLGQTLIEPLTALCAWAEHHLDEVEQARATYQQPQR
ncbi:MAG TPA: helix-turn-helix domain-containing protein [Phototrophicaceae bacterium]|nr:helix-turn-helix domain-containing protein [Phototrophicaceae bacterium]